MVECNSRRRVPVLEEVEVGIASILHLVRDSLASWTRESGDEVRVTGRDGDLTQVLQDRGHVIVRGRFSSNLGQLRDIDLAVATECVVGGLEISPLREEEDQAAGLAGIRRRNVEVEDSRDGWGDCAKLRGTTRSTGRRRVHGNNQVRVLIVARGVTASQSRGAATASRVGRRSRRRSRAHWDATHARRLGARNRGGVRCTRRESRDDGNARAG